VSPTNKNIKKKLRIEGDETNVDEIKFFSKESKNDKIAQNFI
jgi:hypothetical protein